MITVKHSKCEGQKFRGSELEIGDVLLGRTETVEYKGLFLRTYSGLVFLNRPKTDWTWDHEDKTHAHGPKLIGRKVNITITVED